MTNSGDANLNGRATVVFCCEATIRCLAVLSWACALVLSTGTVRGESPNATVNDQDRPSVAALGSYQPSLEHDFPVPQPPAAAVEDFALFLERLREASEESGDSLVLHGSALDRAEQVMRNSAGVPDDIQIERHRPFFAVNPEAIFALYADLPTLERGFALYQQYCSQCHGVYGRGNGAATSQWYVGNYPRNFWYAKYKSRSTEYGTSPTDSDLYRTLTRGLYGSSMPSFRHLSDQDRWALVQLVKSFGNFYDDYDEVVMNRFDLENNDPPTPLDMSGELPASVDSVVRGRALFIKHGCVTCHQGNKSKPVGLGRDDGTFSNWSDEMNRPIFHSRNLTTPIFLAGSAPSDLFRIIAGGPNIGPMPNYQSLSREDSWALVRYIESLFKPDYPQVPESADASSSPAETAATNADSEVN